MVFLLFCPNPFTRQFSSNKTTYRKLYRKPTSLNNHDKYSTNHNRIFLLNCLYCPSPSCTSSYLTNHVLVPIIQFYTHLDRYKTFTKVEWYKNNTVKRCWHLQQHLMIIYKFSCQLAHLLLGNDKELKLTFCRKTMPWFSHQS